MWTNIIGNAVKFVPCNGTISIKLCYHLNDILVMISDNGPGMDDKTGKRVFEKFYQGDISRSTGGNGLGLSLAKRIVYLNQGEILIQSTEGKGSEFTVRLSAENRA